MFCLHVYICTTCMQYWQKRASDYLELELEANMISVRAASALKHSVISAAPDLCQDSKVIALLPSSLWKSCSVYT